MDTLFFLVLLIGVAMGANRAVAITDPDLWWHLRTGQWILQHGAVPTQDIFLSSYGMGKPWVAYHWLFEIILSKIFDLWGLRGILKGVIMMTLACTVALTALLARYVRLPRAMLLAAAANFALLPLETTQPWLFTILFFLIELHFLLQACERNRPAWLLPVIPLLVLWANIHIQFVHGLGLIGIFAVVGSIPAAAKWMSSFDTPWTLRPVWLWGLLVSSLAATLANPYGWHLYAVVIQYATDSVPYAIITELMAPDFRGPTDWAALLLICSAWFSLGKARRKPAILVALLVVSCWFGFRSRRDIWFPVIVSTLALASGMRASSGELRRVRWSSLAIALPLGAALALAAPHFQTTSETALRKAVGEVYPEQAIAWIESHSLQGPLYNSVNWGGYLIWRLPGLPVTIDPRWPVFRRTRGDKDDQLTRAFHTTIGTEKWAEDPELRRAHTILLERDAPLSSILRSDPRYRVVYQDKIAAVFQPKER